MKLLIFKYLDYREFLKDLFDELKQQDSKFSFRSFSRMCGSTSPNFYQLIQSQKINLQLSAIEHLGKEIKLKKKEQDYLKVMVSFDQARTFEERDRTYQRLIKMRATSTAEKIDSGKYKYYSKWYYSAIRALLGYYKFYPGDSLGELGRNLVPAITAQQAESCIKLLNKLGLIVLNKKGYYEQANEVITSGPNLKSMEVIKYQAETMKLAQEALNQQAAKNREVSTLTMNISGKGYESVRKLLISVRKEIIEVVKKDQGDDRVYQLNVQLFPMTKIK